MNYKYFFIGLAIFLIALLGYHYYAANEAADQIDEALQEQAKDSENAFSINYADIDVHPFAGDISFEDLRFTHDNYLHNATFINFDLTYLDFLRFYVGGTEFGLEKLHSSKITAIKPSFEIQNLSRKITADTLLVNYSGNMYDLLRHAVAKRPLQHAHQIQALTRTTNISQTGSSWGTFDLDSLSVETRVPANTNSFLNADHMLSQANGIQWIPPASIQEKYQFFIQGFGYEPDSIAIDSLKVRLSAGDRFNDKNMSGELHTDLFYLHTTANISIDSQSLGKSIINDGTVSIPQISERFDNFLQNSEQLFGVKIPQQRKNLLQYYGPITNPEFSFNRDSR